MGLPHPRRVLAGAGPVLLSGVFAWWATSLPPFSLMASAVVVVSGGAVMVAGTRSPRRQEPPAIPLRAVRPWLAVASAAAAWQVAAYLQHPRDEHPTISSLLNSLLDSHPAQAAGFVLWLVACYGLGRR